MDNAVIDSAAGGSAGECDRVGLLPVGVEDACLRFVLALIADHAIDRVDQLMPWVVAEQPRSHT